MKKISGKSIGIAIVVIALVAVGVWFFCFRETTSGVAYKVVDDMKAAEAQYNKDAGTPQAYDDANDCATAALEAKQFRDKLKASGDEDGLKTFDEIYQPVKNEVKKIVEKEEIFEDEDELNSLFGE